MTDETASGASLASSEHDLSASEANAQPFLQVVSADATPEEVAALVAVLAALGSAAASPERPVMEWNAPYRQVRPAYSHGPGGWRSSGLPRHRGRG